MIKVKLDGLLFMIVKSLTIRNLFFKSAYT